MFAIVDFAGFQSVVRKGDLLTVPRQKHSEPGTTVTMDRVLLFTDAQGNTKVGAPYVEGVKATAEVVDHFRGEKIIIFKKRRRKAYRRRKGHRSDYTTLRITDIEA